MKLGEGGTSCVFLAVAHGASGFNRLVVLKTLKRSLVSQPEARRMFATEARISARLNHPNVVSANEVFDDEFGPVIVMEYLDGQPYSEVTIRGGDELTLAMRLRIIADALAGLDYCHELSDDDGAPFGLVHRDVSPHNIFVTYDGAVKIIDFGIVELRAGEEQTQTSVIKGKLKYMSPEQLKGDPVDRRADIYAVGVMLWEAAARARMWPGLSETSIMNRVMNGKVPSPLDVCPHCPEELDAICRKAMAFDRESRFATAAELQAELEAYLERLGQPTRAELGMRIAEWFADARAEVGRVIQQVHGSEESDLEVGSGLVSLPSSITSTQFSTDHTETQVIPRRTGRWMMLALLLIGASSSAAWFGASWQAPAPMAQANSTAPTASDKAMLRVTVFPSSALLSVDDEQNVGNPYASEVPRSGREGAIRAEAEGFHPELRKIRMNGDMDIVISLRPIERGETGAAPLAAEKRGAAPRLAAPVTQPPAKSLKAAEPEATEPADCSLPYIVDERGIKNFKPECL